MKKKLPRLVILLSTVILLLSGCMNNIDNALQERVNQMNRALPKMEDKYTRIDSCRYMGNLTIRYYCTIVDLPMPENTIPYHKEFGQIKAVSAIRSDKEFLKHADLNLIFEYYYNDMQGKSLFSNIVTPEDYTKEVDENSDEYVCSVLTRITDSKKNRWPYYYNDETFLSKVEVSYPRTINYYINCSQFVLQESDDSIKFIKEYKPALVEDCRHDAFDLLLTNKDITYRYVYTGKDQKYLFTVIIKPDDYK